MVELQAQSNLPPFGFMALSDWYFEMLRDSARPELQIQKRPCGQELSRHDLYERALQVEIARTKALHCPATFACATTSSFSTFHATETPVRPLS